MGQGGPVRAKGVGAQKKVERFAHGRVPFNLFFVCDFALVLMGLGGAGWPWPSQARPRWGGELWLGLAKLGLDNAWVWLRYVWPG